MAGFLHTILDGEIMSSTLNSPARVVTSNVLGAPLNIDQTTFAKLPNPINLAGQIWQVTDVGNNGSLWSSNGVTWTPVNGVVNLYKNVFPFIVPSSGSVTVTTGALALTTALDQIYPSCYMYFPAGTWTASTAGWYYVVMTSTTVGTVYNTAYTTGIPTAPSTLSVVTTGAGAYTQTVLTYLPGQIFTIPGNIIGATGRLVSEVVCSTPSTSDAKYLQLSLGSTDFTSIGLSSATVANLFGITSNQGVANKQTTFIYDGVNNGSTTLSTVDTTVAQTVKISYYLTTDTDWLAFQWLNLQVTQ